jgi:hypothetical protein
MTDVEFEITNWLRFISVICLGIGDIILIHDRFVMVILLFVIAGTSELLRKRLYEVMLFNHEVTKRNEKVAARKVQEQALRELKESQAKRSAA